MIVRRIISGILGVLFLLVSSPTVWATTTYSSPNYQVQQVFFGAGGDLQNSSPNYNAKTSVGELGVGNINSPDYQAYVGFNTTAQPFLEFVVTQQNIDLGYLKTNNTATANGQFYIRAWQSSGYTVQTDTPGPSNGEGYTLASPTTPTASTQGTEQFGMNLVQNVNPNTGTGTFGANPVQTTSFAYGQAASNYNVANKYMYKNGDTVALCTSSTSSTIYTISYIFNVASDTAAGQYTFNQNLVATADY